MSLCNLSEYLVHLSSLSIIIHQSALDLEMASHFFKALVIILCPALVGKQSNLDKALVDIIGLLQSFESSLVGVVKKAIVIAWMTALLFELTLKLLLSASLVGSIGVEGRAPCCVEVDTYFVVE
jgi:hypothetical protein